MHISVISVACIWCTHHEVQGMLPNKSSENLEIKMLKSFSVINNQSSFQNITFLEKVWLHIAMVELLVM